MESPFVDIEIKGGMEHRIIWTKSELKASLGYVDGQYVLGQEERAEIMERLNSTLSKIEKEGEVSLQVIECKDKENKWYNIIAGVSGQGSSYLDQPWKYVEVYKAGEKNVRSSVLEENRKRRWLVYQLRSSIPIYSAQLKKVCWRGGGWFRGFSP